MTASTLNYFAHNGLMTFFVCEWAAAIGLCGVMVAVRRVKR